MKRLQLGSGFLKRKYKTTNKVFITCICSPFLVEQESNYFRQFRKNFYWIFLLFKLILNIIYKSALLFK